MKRPLLGLVSRFTPQKGTDLLVEIAAPAGRRRRLYGGAGTGDPEYEEFFRLIQREYPGRIAVRIGFDNGLAHRIEAGADMFLMPSRYEPCGLNQIYSLRYGTVPVVRATGGLDDTIEEGTGFKFPEYSGPALFGSGPSRRARLRGPRGLAADDAAGHARGFLVEDLGGGLFGACTGGCWCRLNPFGPIGILIVRLKSGEEMAGR